MEVFHAQFTEVPQQVKMVMKALLLLVFLAYAAAQCDKVCPIANEYLCVSREEKCFYNIRHPCILDGINCYRANKNLTALTTASSGKCNSTSQVPICKMIDST